MDSAAILEASGEGGLGAFLIPHHHCDHRQALLDYTSCCHLTFSYEPLEFQGIRPMSKGSFLQPQTPGQALSCVCVLHTSRGTYPRHILHEDSESLLSAVPQTAIVLHNALVLQVFQQLDLTLQSTHLLGERPVFTSALRALVCLPGISSACPSRCPQRGLSALGTSAGETGDSLNCLAVGLNAGQPFECWHSNTGNRKIVGWEKDLWVLGNCCTSGN